MAGIWARTDATPRRAQGAGQRDRPRRAQPHATGSPATSRACSTTPASTASATSRREGIRVWGARTLAAAASEWRYLNVRRLFNMIEESIAEGTRWIVFEPNDRTLWKLDPARHRRVPDPGVARRRAAWARTPEEAFFVKCDEETNPPEVLDAGQVVAVIGIAPVKPAEFVVFQVSQSAAGAEVSAVAAGG